MHHGYGAVAKKRFPGARIYSHPHSMEVEDKDGTVLVSIHRDGNGGFQDAEVDGTPLAKYSLAVLQTEGNRLEDYEFETDPDKKARFKPKPPHASKKSA